MKILHVYKDFDPPVYGGMERHVALMCRFQRAWAEVEALTCSRTWRTRVAQRDGTRVTEVGEWGRFQSAPVSPLFPVYLRRQRSDIIVVHVPNPTAEIAWLLARPRARLVIRYQSDVVRQAAGMKVYGPAQREFLGRADMILASSEQYLASSPVLQRVRERCRVVPLGIDPDLFAQPDPDQLTALRARYGPGNGDGYVLFFGRHRYYKGLEYLVQAAPRIQAPVVIAGDGPERRRCQALAEKLGVPVAFPGQLSQEDLVAHLHGCAVFVLPSIARSEAFGMVILEAHACCKPVVATRLGTGVEFVNHDGVTGLNVPPRDALALAEAVNLLLADKERRRIMGEAARERVYREFHARDIARREFELYQRVLEDSRSHA